MDKKQTTRPPFTFSNTLLGIILGAFLGALFAIILCPAVQSSDSNKYKLEYPYDIINYDEDVTEIARVVIDESSGYYSVITEDGIEPLRTEDGEWARNITAFKTVKVPLVNANPKGNDNQSNLPSGDEALPNSEG